MICQDKLRTGQAGENNLAKPSRRKTVVLRHVYIKMLIVPRQARDKHRENSPKDRFLCSHLEPHRGAQRDGLVSCRRVNLNGTLEVGNNFLNFWVRKVRNAHFSNLRHGDFTAAQRDDRGEHRFGVALRTKGVHLPNVPPEPLCFYLLRRILV